jgi:hypothetical protein
VVADPLMTKIAIRSEPALRGGVALVTTFVGLLIGDLGWKPCPSGQGGNLA